MGPADLAGGAAGRREASEAWVTSVRARGVGRQFGQVGPDVGRNPFAERVLHRLLDIETLKRQRYFFKYGLEAARLGIDFV